MNLDLKNREWEEFVFEELFDINSTSSGIDRNKLINKEGTIPYLTRTERNNGYDSFICKQDDKYKTNKANVIIIGLDTQTVFYQPTIFYTGQNIQILENENLNRSISCFLLPLIKRQMEKFSWGGNGATLTRLRRSKILLPINTEEEPDYEFMEAFMKQKEKELLDKYQNYINKNNSIAKLNSENGGGGKYNSALENLNNFKEVEPLNKKEWVEFYLKDIFPKIQRGRRLKKADHKKGIMPYVSSTGSNNGVDGYVGNKNNVRVFNNSLTLANSGSVGACFYQPFEFVASDHVTQLKNKELNPFVYKFISLLISRLGIKYSFNREINDKRVKREKILLPINKNQEPDYEYMENYMKVLEYKKLQAYLDYKNKK